MVVYFVGGSRLILSLSPDLLRARQEVAAAAAARNPGAMEAHIPSGSNSSSQRRKQGLPQHRDTHFPERYLRGGGHGSARPLGRAGRGSPPPRGGVSSGHGLGKGLRFLGKGLGGLQAAPWGPQGAAQPWMRGHGGWAAPLSPLVGAGVLGFGGGTRRGRWGLYALPACWEPSQPCLGSLSSLSLGTEQVKVLKLGF